MTEQEYIAIFIKDPKYTSPWIGKASTILSTYGNDEITINWIKQYNYEQLISINDILDYNVSSARKMDLSVYADPKLNGTQMQLYLRVFQEDTNLDFEETLRKIVDPKYPYEKLNWVCSALAEGLDLTDHIDTFDVDQLAALYAGFKDGVDIRKYDDNNIPANAMNIIRHALSVGYSDIKYDSSSDTITISKE